MASISRDKNGKKRVCFTDLAGVPRAIRLGDVSVKAAESFKLRVEALLQDKIIGRSHDAELADWLASRPQVIRKRLANVGLAEPLADVEIVKLGGLLDRIEAALTVKDGTRITYLQAFSMLRDYFGVETPVTSITPAQADEWRKSITQPNEGGKVLASATVAKRVRVAKGVFQKAVKWGILRISPFADLRAGSQSNPDRAHYITLESAKSILAACPDDQWRAIIALSRFAGLRCPSEIVSLRWGDVNWERGRMSVRSPKTAGHEGHAIRVVPIAPELRPILQDLFDRAEPGTEAVVPRLRDPSVNLRTSFMRIIAKAGEKPWPRLFHNMRSSCASDWVERFPNHVVAAWLGHSPMIAAQHYLQTRDAHFDLAAGSTTNDQKSDAQSDAPEARNEAKHAPAPARTGRRESSEEPCFSVVSRADASECETAAKWESDPDGIRTHVPTVKG